MSTTQPTTTATSHRLPIWRQIRWVLVFTFVLMAIVPASIIAGMTISRAAAQAQEQVLNELDAVGELKHASIDRWLIDSQSMLELFSTGPRERRLMRVANMDRTTEAYIAEAIVLQELLNATLDSQSLLSEIFLYTPEGDLILSSDQTQVGQTVVNQPYFDGSLIGNAPEHEVIELGHGNHIDFIKSPYLDPSSGELTMVITHALVDEVTGEIEVIVAGRPNLEILNEIMLERAGLGESGETYLVGLENNYLLTESRFEDVGSQFTPHTSEGINNALNGEDGQGAYDDYRGVPVLGVYRWVPELEVALLSELDTSEALASARQTSNVTLLIGGITAVLAIGLGLVIAGYIANPIIALTRTAAQIERGNFEHEAIVTQDNEIGLLANAFNNMTTQLQTFITSLEERVAERTRALEISADVSRSLSTILDQDELTEAVVNRVNEEFGYYHTQIYLWNEDETRLMLVGGTGSAGQELLASNHSIEPGKGLVGKAAETNAAVLVPDVTQDASWMPNPLLPETKAEAAVPIALGSQVLGVLDVQHRKANGLDEQDIGMLQSIANQVTVGLQNTRLYAATQARARQESIINEINQKILQTTDMESAMKVAIRELGRAVDAPQTAVRLKNGNGHSNGHGD